MMRIEINYTLAHPVAMDALFAILEDGGPYSLAINRARLEYQKIDYIKEGK